MLNGRTVFTLGSAVALTGLVAACVGGGEFSNIVGQDAATGNPPNTSTPPSGSGGGTKFIDGSTKIPISKDAGDPDPNPDSCKDTTATFTPTAINPPTTPTNVCTTQVLGALADACNQDPAAAACTTARSVTANKTCAECIFGSKLDAKWKVINIDNAKASFNQAGCIDQVTGVAGCGAAYINIVKCANTYCAEAPTGTCDSTSASACFNEIRAAECKPYFLGNNVSSDDDACSNALSAKSSQIDTSCFAQDATATAAKTFFINIATITCMK